jgi:hypothetical protein
MPRLIQMPDGSWFDTSYILGVEAVDEHDDDLLKHHFNPRVILHLQGDRRVFECASFDRACRVRDELASKINR